MKHELVKVVCVAVVANREGDRIVSETEGPPIACYGPDQLAAFWEAASGEVSTRNALENPPRAERRRSRPRAKGGARARAK